MTETSDVRDDGLNSPDTENENEFAQMLEESEKRSGEVPEPKAGDKVTGTIIQLDGEQAFVDFGGRSELPLDAKELKDADGNPTHEVGSEITAYVTGKGSDLSLTLSRKVQGKDTSLIEEALASGMPLDGTVRETNKGGFVVDLGGHRAFCPISQIDDRFVEDPQPYVGRTLQFRVIEFSEGGRRLVVSRRALLKEERERLAVETRKTLAAGDVREGVVTRIMPFGAFVDIGGVEGLVHVSEISFERVHHPGDVLAPDQQVRVKVMDVQNLGQGRSERISLSLRALESDPWAKAANKYAAGIEVEGKITGLADFGAFVQLEPGIQGLIHISEISDVRIDHPSDVLQEGQEVNVRVLELDQERKRISLALVR